MTSFEFWNTKAWATKDLPARLDVMATAKLLGFGEYDIQILMAARKLVPLGTRPSGRAHWPAARGRG
jgi:hypothetical protein